MNHQTVLFFTTLGLFLAALVATSVYAYVHSRRRQSRVYGNWETIFARFTEIDRTSVECIALDFLSAADTSTADRAESITGQDALVDPGEELDPAEIWPLIGGMEGLEILRRNCAVLVDMAFYVQQWYPEALAVAEQLRLNAREIEWHVDRLKGAARTGKLESAFPDYAQRAITTYYLMTRRVLELFEQGDFPGRFDLQRAL